MKRLVVCAVVFGIALAWNMSYGQEKPALPEDVREMMGYLVGFWEIEGTLDGAATQGTMSVRWSPGNHCQIYHGRLWTEGDRKNAVHVTILCGYDAAKDQAVETAYWSDGSHGISRYNMTPRIVDKGTIRGERSGVLAGEDIEGTIQAERQGPDEFVWTVSDTDGKETKLYFHRAEPPQRRKKAEK